MKFATTASALAITSLVACFCSCASDPSGLQDGNITVIEPDYSTTWYHAAQYPKTVEWSGAIGHQVRAYIYDDGDFVALAHIWTNHEGEGSFTRNISSWGTGDRYQIKLEDSDGNSGWSEYFSIAEQPGAIDTLFFDDFERTCPSDWGTPVIGSTYTYINPGGAIFTVAEGVGYIDDETTHKDGLAKSYLADSTLDMVSFSWKYQAGHFSGLQIYNDDARVLGVWQHQNGDQLKFWTPEGWIDIQNRTPDEWINYRIECNDPLTEFFVNDSLVYSCTYSPGQVNIINFVVNGAGDPSDSWFDNVLVVRHL